MTINRTEFTAARVLLDLDQKDIGVISQPKISAFETGRVSLSAKNRDRLQQFYENQGIEFVDGGARLRKSFIQYYEGVEGFKLFMDDVYEVAKNRGRDICIFNSKPELWYKWLTKEWYEKHAKRMQALGEKIRVRIIVQAVEDVLILRMAQHRSFPKDLHAEKIIYAFGPKLAFLDFSKNNVGITVHNHAEFADNYRATFELAWDHSEPINQEKE